MKRIFTILCIISSINLSAQTGIGTTTPNASAKLDVYSDNKGFLPPRVTLTSATDNTTIPSPAEGLLVYNKGSVALQAGYYYWNGANWATIATATSAGNGVTASDMVKLYSKAYSAATADSTIANATGYKFTVPVSGRYLFDFSSSGYVNQTSMTITFKIRQGATDLATDAQTGNNNNVHVEYNGKLEVNLQAGVTYNVYVTSTGSRDAGDYDRVYYKMVAGNLPVTGQTVDYVSVTRTSVQSVNDGDNVLFNQINGGNIPYNTTTGNFTLTAGKTYRLTGYISLANTNASAEEVNVAWKTAAGEVLSNKGELLSANFASTAAAVGVADVIYTPSTNTTVSLSVIYTSSGVVLWGNFTYANIQQIGSSAIVNPWVLSGNDVYNITGEVGIGTNAPDASAIVDINSSTKGLLPPRVALTARNGTSSPIASPTTGLFVYNTATAGTAANAVSPGFYFFNGTNWTRMDPEGWSTPVAITIGAVTTAPTKGTVVYDKVSYRRTSTTSYEVTYSYSQSTSGTGGSGDYLFTLPGGLSFGSSVLKTTSTAYEDILNKAIISSGFVGDTNGRFRALAVIPYDGTRFRIMGMDASFTGVVVDNTSFGLGSDGQSYKFSFILDIN